MARFWGRVGALFGVLVIGFGLVFWNLKGTVLNVFSLAGIVVGLALIVWGMSLNATSLAQTVRSKRGALGVNQAVMFVLAVALAAIINYWAFGHYERFDWTHDSQFTIPADTHGQLTRLKEPIDIVVYIAHKTFGRGTKKPDAYDYAAERKVVEKVRDLVERYGEIGAQIRVQVLDVEEEGSEKKLTALNPLLRAEVEKAAENSIFFRSGTHVQRLSFSDYYQLDKTASKARQNLVLLARGQQAFSRQIFNVDERKPRLVFAVCHELLGLEGEAEFGMRGVADALRRWGMTGRTVMLKEWSQMAPPKAAVLSYKENEYKKLQDQAKAFDARITHYKEAKDKYQKLAEKLTKKTLKELTEEYKDRLGDRKFTEEMRRQNVLVVRAMAADAAEYVRAYAEAKVKVAALTAAFDKSEIEHLRKFTHQDEKLAYVLQDCDLLVVPRYTWQKVNVRWGVPNEVHQLEKAQVDAFRRYLKEGHPLLAVLGPSTETPPSPWRRPPPPKPPLLENLLRQYGVELDKKLILFNVEAKTFSDQISSAIVPPLVFEGAATKATPDDKARRPAPNPVAQSMQGMARGLDLALNIRAQHPRVVRYSGADQKSDPHFVWTAKDCWSETRPFPEPGRYEPKPDTMDEEKLLTGGGAASPGDEQPGPLPIGVAIEKPADPSSWDSQSAGATTRLAVLGKAALITGPQLPPENEKLFINVVNWLLGRDYLLGLETTEWSYPRMAITAQTKALWLWFLRLGIPVLCAFAGAVVLMYRRLNY